MCTVVYKALQQSHTVSAAWGSPLPVVGELQLQTGVVSCFYGDDVSAEVGPQEKAECLDNVGPLGLPTGQTKLGELLIRAKHHKFWAKDNPREVEAKQIKLQNRNSYCRISHCMRDIKEWRVTM